MQKTLLLLTTALIIHGVIPKTHAAGSVSVDFFYDQLGEYGDWVEAGDYGYCWQPRDVDEDWRPYSDGRWAYTDAGWTWQSEEPYGWAVYHYGRWARVARKGWLWIPGTEWAPAWVSWRRSPQHVGWAPLPPEARFRRGVGFSGWVDSYYDIGPSAYRFVVARDFGAPRLRSVFVEPRENVTIIQQTTNITNVTYINNVVNNGGPRFDEISRESAEPIRRLKLDRRANVQDGGERGEQMRTRVEGDSLRVFAPGFDARPAVAPRKLAAKIEKVEVNRGWADAGPPADVEKLRAKVRAEASVPKALPPQPKFEKLAEQATPKAGQKNPPATTLGEKPIADAPKDGRKPGEPPVAPNATPRPDEKSEAIKPPVTEPVQSERKGEHGKQPKKAPPVPVETTEKKQPSEPVPQTPPQPVEPTGTKPQAKPAPQPPVQPGEPTGKKSHPKPPQQPVPSPERPQQTAEKHLPPPPAPRPEAPAPPKPKMDRPQPRRDVPPPVERPKPKSEQPQPQNVAPGNAPHPAPPGDAEKPKPGKGKSKDGKKPENEEPKPQ